MSFLDLIVKTKCREELLAEKSGRDRNNSGPIFVATFNHHFKKIKGIINKYILIMLLIQDSTLNFVICRFSTRKAPTGA